MKRLLLLLLASCAAEPDRLRSLPAGAEGPTLAFMREDGSRLFAFDRASLPDPLELAPGEYWVLSFSQRIEALFAPLPDDGEVSLTGEGERWPLVAPAAAFELDTGAALEPARASAVLTRLQVPRPPCPTLEARGLVVLQPNESPSFAAPWGDEVIVGSTVNGAAPPGLYTLAGPDAPPVRVPGFEGVLGPVAVTVAGDHAYVVVPLEGGGHELRTLARDGSLVERAPIANDFDDGVYVSALVSGKEGGELTLLAVLSSGGADPPFRSYAAALRPSEGRWRLLHSIVADSSGPCDRRARILRFDGPGRGWLGLPNGPIVRFDLSLADPLVLSEELVPGGVYCASAYARLDTGAELVSYEDGSSGGVLWRRSGSTRWMTLQAPAFGQVDLAAALGELGLVSSGANGLAVVEHAILAPELPLRACAGPSVPFRPRTAISLPGGRVFVFGLRGATFVGRADP